MDLKIILPVLFDAYLGELPRGMRQAFESLQDAALSTPNFSFYISVASVFSSKIEGEAIELDSYVKHKREGIAFRPDYTKKIDDLYGAYLFAQDNPLNEKNVKEAHRLLGKHLLASPWQGKYRKQNMYVATEDGRIEYVAAPPQQAESDMSHFFEDIAMLLDKQMEIEEVFYYASMIHLVFVKIHPWNDGNGRCARMIEKWFLAEKLGQKAWYLQSEKMYYQHHQTYYNNIRTLGLEYLELNYGKALPFLLILPNCLNTPLG